MRIVAFITTLSAVTAAVPAAACAPSPMEAAERFATARAQCDFVAAWEFLAPTERGAHGSQVDWTQRSLTVAAAQLTCHEQVSNFAGEAPVDGTAEVTFTSVEPVAAIELRALLRDSYRVSYLNRGVIEDRIAEVRARFLLASDPGPSARSTRRLTVVRSATGWCIDEGHAEHLARSRAAAERASAEAQRLQAEREEKERLAAAARERGAAALPDVSVADVSVGQTTLRERGVFGEVVNRSAETLREIEIRIDYLDRGGAVAAEAYHVVLMHGSSMYRRDNMPLPPGQRRRFGRVVQEPPSTWAGRVRVEVVRVEADPSAEPHEPRGAARTPLPVPPIPPQ